MSGPTPTTGQKASRINVDDLRHGTFAEIGAGQEVVRWFFHVGGAAGTVAKTVSAYDMAVSDAAYGPTDRYVSRERLTAMLGKEFEELLRLLGPKRGATTALFVFADTVATRSFTRHNDGHGWMGVRFQHRPGAEPSEIVIHVRMLDRENAREQEALGILGVNLVYGAFYHAENPAALIGSLLDELNHDRVEVDLIRFSGPCFAEIDNRLTALQLVEQRLTAAAMFTARGEVAQPADALHGRPVLIERGTFRPITRTGMDMLESARARFTARIGDVDPPAVVMEMSLGDLVDGGQIDHADFLARADVLGALGQTVMISNFGPYYPLSAVLRRCTSKPIAFAMGIPSVVELFQPKYYADLPGGLLESLGRLFCGDVTILVYPTRTGDSTELVTLERLRLPDAIRPLYDYLVQNDRLLPLEVLDEQRLHVLPRDVLGLIRSGDPTWTSLVPEAAVDIIESKRLFGYRPPGDVRG